MLTPVIRMELCNWLSGYQSLTSGKRALLLSFIKSYKLIHIGEDISKLSIALSDKNINAKPGDTLIAATALHYGLPVYTLNKKDFRQLGVGLYE